MSEGASGGGAGRRLRPGFGLALGLGLVWIGLHLCTPALASTPNPSPTEAYTRRSPVPYAPAPSPPHPPLASPSVENGCFSSATLQRTPCSPAPFWETAGFSRPPFRIAPRWLRMPRLQNTSASSTSTPWPLHHQPLTHPDSNTIGGALAHTAGVFPGRRAPLLGRVGEGWRGDPHQVLRGCPRRAH